jgi:hypothetical protein
MRRGSWIGEALHAASQRALDALRKIGAVAATQQSKQFVGVMFRGGALIYVANFFFGPDARAWIDSLVQEPRTFTYAAVFDKQDPVWPLPIVERVDTYTQA